MPSCSSQKRKNFPFDALTHRNELPRITMNAFPSGFGCVFLLFPWSSHFGCVEDTLWIVCNHHSPTAEEGLATPQENRLQHMWKSNDNRQLLPSKKTMDSQLVNKSVTVSNTIFAESHCLHWQNLLHNAHSLLPHGLLLLHLFTHWNLDERQGRPFPQNMEHGRWTPRTQKIEFHETWNVHNHGPTEVQVPQSWTNRGALPGFRTHIGANRWTDGWTPRNTEHHQNSVFALQNGISWNVECGIHNHAATEVRVLTNWTCVSLQQNRGDQSLVHHSQQSEWKIRVNTKVHNSSESNIMTELTTIQIFQLCGLRITQCCALIAVWHGRDSMPTHVHRVTSLTRLITRDFHTRPSNEDTVQWLAQRAKRQRRDNAWSFRRGREMWK